MQRVTAEIYEPDETLPPDLRALRRFAILLDDEFAIPGVKRRIGINPAIGLVPVVGDVIGAILSTWIIAGALRHRVPLPTLFRMVGNIAVTLTIGTIPLFGDLFDFFFRENLANIDLLIRQRDRTRPPRSAGQVTVIIGTTFALLALLVIFVLFLLIAVAVWAVRSRGDLF
jgi:hypothetical protein